MLLGQPVTSIWVFWFECRAVLRDELHGHHQRLGAQAAVRPQGRVLALGERQFEAAEGAIGDCLEGRAGDPRFADERRSHQVDRDAIALQHHRQGWEGFAAVADEVSRGPRELPGGSGFGRSPSRSPILSGNRPGWSGTARPYRPSGGSSAGMECFGDSTLTLATFA